MRDGIRRDASDGGGRIEAINASWAYEELIKEVLRTHRNDIQRLIEPNVAVGQASPEDDLRKATDYYAAIQVTGLRLAVRVRSFQHLGPYGNELVFRDTAPPGFPTEADKILTDPESANFYLYAFTDIVGLRFAQYILVDLERLRSAWADDGARGILEPRRVCFSPNEAGLTIRVDGLRELGCIVGAAMAAHTFTSRTQTRAVLEGIDSYAAMGDHDRSRVEILLMKLMFHTGERIGGSPS